MSVELEDIYTGELSDCCEAKITLNGFCSDCWEHA